VHSLTRAERRFPDSADLQNDLGFAYRNLKQFDEAFRHYKRALVLDPRHRGAHEYIGEAYLMIGDLPSAERHLAALREICLLPCEELDDLGKAVDAYKSRTR
jgi:Flp pilus assembly protein TadD